MISEEFYTGIKIPTNPADCDCQILGAEALKKGNWTDLVNDRNRCIDGSTFRSRPDIHF
jgi:hypothetical protein